MRAKESKFKNSQATVEYTILFAVVLAALIGSLFFTRAGETLRGNFQDMVSAAAADSLESSEIGSWE